MSEASAYTPPKLSPGRYRIVQTTDGDWFVLDARNKRLFADRIFDRADDAANRLIALATVDGISYTPLYDRHTGVVREVVIGKPPQGVVLSLTLSPELDADLDNLAEDLGTTKGDAVLKGIALLKIAAEAKREGKRVAILDDRDDSEQDITGF